MMVVRKEGKAHSQYNSFRSAFELLEAVGREPHDHFEETEENVSPLQRLQQQMSDMRTSMLLRASWQHQMKSSMQQQMSDMQQQMSDMRTRESDMQQQMSDMQTRESSMQQEIDELQTKNKVLESKLNALENHVVDEQT